MKEIQFGSTQAAKILSELVYESDDSKKLNRKISRYLNQYNDAVIPFELKTDSELKVRDLYLFGLVCKDFEERAEVIAEGKVLTFLRNVIRSRYRRFDTSFIFVCYNGL